MDERTSPRQRARAHRQRGRVGGGSFRYLGWRDERSTTLRGLVFAHPETARPFQPPKASRNGPILLFTRSLVRRKENKRPSLGVARADSESFEIGRAPPCSAPLFSLRFRSPRDRTCRRVSRASRRSEAAAKRDAVVAGGTAGGGPRPRRERRLPFVSKVAAQMRRERRERLECGSCMGAERGGR